MVPPVYSPVAGFHLVSLCVVVAKCSPGDTYCSGNYHRNSYSCVVEITVKAEIKDGCGQGHHSRGLGNKEEAIVMS